MTDPSSIPSIELETLLLTVNEAVDCANADELTDGYTALLASLERAREVGEGEEWGPLLVARWKATASSTA